MIIPYLKPYIYFLFIFFGVFNVFSLQDFYLYYFEIGEKLCQLQIILKCFAFLSKNQLLGTTQFNDDVDIKSRHAAVNEL